VARVGSQHDEGAYKKTEDGDLIHSNHEHDTRRRVALVDPLIHVSISVRKQGRLGSYKGSSGCPMLREGEDGTWEVVGQLNSGSRHYDDKLVLNNSDAEACDHPQCLGITSVQIVQMLQMPQQVAQAAAGFALTGLPAGHGRAYYMTEYKRCDGREKVEGRHVYEGTDASGGDKVYCWYNDGGWFFSDCEKHIGTSTGTLGVGDGAAAPEQVKSTSTWKALANGEWEVVPGMKVQALSAAQIQQRQEQRQAEVSYRKHHCTHTCHLISPHVCHGHGEEDGWQWQCVMLHVALTH
jgi:hypothetical protein